MLVASEAIAQGLFGGGGAAAGQPDRFMSLLVNMGPFILMLLIFYVLLFVPQQQQAKKTKQMLAALKRGDKVVTNGGIIGTVVGLEDNKATLRIADDVKVEFLKSSIVQVVPEGSGK